MSDKKIQFSKLIVLMCILLMIVGITVALWATVIFCLPESVAIAIIGASGTLGATAVVWNLKKSQAENTMKIYLSTYKEIIEIKKENNEDVSLIIDDVENNILNKISYNMDASIDEATSSIEKQDIL